MGSRAAWLAFWTATAVLSAAWILAVRPAVRERLNLLPAGALAVPVFALAATLVVALVSAPNNWDSMVYHNARVMEWWSRGSVAPWVTSIERQVRMPPLASYVKLALFGLTQSDVLFNLVQWVFFAFSIAAGAALAGRLTPGFRAGRWTALLVATTPMAILESTSTQNDLVVTGYLLVAAFFLLRAFAEDGAPARDLALFGAALGLAVATKGTAFLLGAPLLAAALVGVLARLSRPREPARRAFAGGLAAALALVVLPNAAFWWRNAAALGSPAGTTPEIVRPSEALASGAGRAAALAVSQTIRAAALQLGDLRVVGLEAPLFSAITRVHRALGLRADEPAVSGTIPFSAAARQPLNHEDTAPSTSLFLLLGGTTALALLRTSLPGRRALLPAFAVGWAGWFLVALAVRWMPWNARLQLPALLLLAVPAGAVVAAGLPRHARAALAFVLIAQALPALLFNSSRPLLGLLAPTDVAAWPRSLVSHGARSIFSTARWEDYFRDRPALQVEVEAVIGEVAARCAPGGVARLDLDGDAWEYALWVGARRRAPGVRLWTGEPLPGEGAPCAVVRTSCPDTRAFCLAPQPP